jgi:catalase
MRHIENCLKVDKDYGKGVAQALGLNIGKEK